MSKSLPASVLSLAQLLEQQSPAPPPLDRHGRITGFPENDTTALRERTKVLSPWRH